MRTATIEVYKIDELSESAKEKAFNKFCANDCYNGDDNRNTLSKFEEVFPVKVTNYEYGYHNYINYKFTADDDIENLSGIRLMKHIYNNYFTDLFKGKYFSKGKYINDQYTYKYRHSKVMFENCCVLTGYCIDDDILEPIYKFLKKPEEHIIFTDLMYDCLQSWIYACNADYEAYYSMESFEDIARINEYEYTEDGEMF